ncbi:hypothetical protein K432DRAFT_405676 [Lepidopterella palustris CBS 459.81]|uniref:Mid2 domain-containing protein n=1 Tax=Lepidopterella palustris CBS 459.81 TaxID=1314670 RepID=A0A8E2E8V3_9PEZI|nr:hypothetical protein K432DRAFT_405676 [Lepidopterella palustris CBS 459.81]
MVTKYLTPETPKSTLTAPCSYYPDGSFPQDYTYQACTGDTYSSCCIPSEGDQCMSNGLCFYPGGQYLFRGACTDKTWSAKECFQHCKTGDSASSYDELVSCGGTKYCCSSTGSTCCNDDTKVFDAGSASIINDFASTASGSLPTASPSDVNGGAAPMSTTYTPHKHTSDASSVANTAAASTSTSSPSPPASKSTSHLPIIIGAAAGAILLILAVLIAWFLARRHYKKKASYSGIEQPVNSYPLSSDGFQRLPDKSPRPVETPISHQTPAPPYQPPIYPAPHGAMELESPYQPPKGDQWGRPVYEAP